MTVRTKFEEVRDCRSEVGCILFFVPSGYCKLCEELRSLKRKFAGTEIYIIYSVSQNNIFIPHSLSGTILFKSFGARKNLSKNFWN